MPVVRYQPDQAQTQVVRQPRADASAGAAAIQGSIDAAQGLTDLVVAGAELKQRVDTTSAEEAIVAFEKDKNDLFFNPESGYFNTQGKNAYDNAAAATESLNELKKRYGENLNDNARNLFNKSADAQILRSQSDIARHSSKGLKAWEVATVQAQVENTIENSSLYWNQPDKLRVQNALGRQHVIDAANLEGVGAEATNERLQTYDSTFFKGTINAAVSNSSAEGQAALDQYGDKLEGHDKIKIEKMIAAKAKTEKTQADSQQAVINGARIADTFDSREDVRNEVNQIEDPDLRKKTMTEAMRQFNLKKQGEKEAQVEAFDRAESHVLNGGSAETYQVEDPEGWERLSAKQKKSIEVGKAVITDWNVYSDLMTLPKAELAKVDPTEHFHQLAPGERRSLVSAVKSANGTGSSADKIDHQIGRTRNSQTTAAVEQILGKKSKWNDKKIQQANAFYDLLDGEVKFREQQKGSSLSSEEFTDVLSDLTREVTIEKSAFGLDVLAPDEELSVTDIPPENVRVLSKFLRDNGIPVTSENLLKAQRQAGE
ncbi:hypothetical protein [Vibrio phage MZH0603]|nr:hypothetical protein [Vibrio phage MZH0603]